MSSWMTAMAIGSSFLEAFLDDFLWTRLLLELRLLDLEEFDLKEFDLDEKESEFRTMVLVLTDFHLGSMDKI